LTIRDYSLILDAFFNSSDSVHMYSQLTLSSKGLMLAGNLLAKRTANGALAMNGQEARIQALLIAAYGKPVSKRVMDTIKKAGALLANVQDSDWDNRTPHQPDKVPVLAKAHMLLALTGLGSMEEENLPRLVKAMQILQKGVPVYELLKTYLRKDDDGDNEDYDDDEEDDDDDDDDSEGDGSGHYDPNEPRIPAGQPGAGQWTTGGNGVSADRGNISAEDVTSNVTDGAGDSVPRQISGTDITTSGSSASGSSSSTPVPVTLTDGSVVIDPATGQPILMPNNVSLQDNVAFGQRLANLPSIMTGDIDTTYTGPVISPDTDIDPNSVPAKEAAMMAAFMPDGTMDYQRIASSLQDSDGNILIDRNYINFGNFNYGVVAAAAGYSLDQALAAAGTLNFLHSISNSNIDTSGAYDDSTRNEYFIRMGYQAYASGKI